MTNTDQYKVTIVCDTLHYAFECQSDEDVLSAMKRAHLAVVPVGCRGGGCGVCRVEVDSGKFVAGKMSVAHVSRDEMQARTAALACKMFPVEDVVIRPTGRLFQKIQTKIERKTQSLENHQPR